MTASLRERAEKILREMPDGSLENLDALSPETLRASLRELRVHQIELEMQNAELLRAQEAMDASRARYFDLSDLAPVGYITERKNEREELLSFRTAVEQTANTIVITDPEGNIKYVNPAFEKATGYTANEAIGQNPRILKGGEQAPSFYQKLWAEIKSGHIWRGEFHNKRKDGSLYWESAIISPVRNEQGAIVHFIAVKEDITGKKALEEILKRSESRFRELFEHSPVAYQSLDDSGRFLDVNNELCALLGQGRDGLIGKSFGDFWSPDTADRFPATFEHFKCSGATSGELALVRGDGTPLTVMLEGRIQYGSDGGFIRTHCVLYNITERKNHERELELARDAAKSATQAKSEFLAIMSHEIRNPLNGILGFAEILAETPLNDEQQSCTEAIEESGAHLLSLINDVLDFSSIEKGALAIHAAPFALAHLVKSSTDIVRKSAADKGLTIHCDVAAGVPAQITGDERRIRQILINLLANAVKFTSDGSVSLRVTCSGEFLDFSVEDTGLGISSEALARLFKLFSQADSTINQKYGGTGIGLAVSGRLAAAMGGTISVVSAPGKGTTFTFRLPLEVPAGGTGTPPVVATGSAAENIASPAMGAHARLPVLVVDDDRSHSLMVGQILQSLGCRAEFAGNGAEAVEAFAPGKYLAILMDLRMPVMNGFEAVAIIRSRESGSRVPIIALTGNVMASSPEAYFAAGMDDFLAKPFKRSELAAVLACFAQ